VIELSVSPDDIERVLKDWERMHPGKIAVRDLTSKEFADMMVADLYARARLTNPPEKKP
jgi:hypothetical protein